MSLTIKNARARLAACGESCAMRDLVESILDSWSDCEGRLDDAESEAANAHACAEDLSCQVAQLESKLDAFECVPSLVDKILGHEDAVSESLDTYNLRRAVDDIRSM